MGKKSKRMKIDAKTYRGTLDEVLANKNLLRKAIAKDGSCLFRAVAEQVYCSQHYHQTVRDKCVEYIDVHRDDFKEFITIPLDQYLEHLSRELWGGEVELVVLSRLYNRSITVYHELESNRIQEQIFSACRDEEKMCAVDKLTNPILLAYLDGNHYDGVYTCHHMETLSFCQGLLYTSLMERVFKDTIPATCKKKLYQLLDSDIDKIKSLYKEKQTNSTLKEFETKALLNLSCHYGEEEVVAMSWTKYHNSSLHLHKMKRETTEAKDRCIAASIQFRVRDKCCFFIDGRRMTGEIGALNSKPGQHLVYIHKSENDGWEIPANDLTLLSSTQSFRKSLKKQSLQQSVEQETPQGARKHQPLKTPQAHSPYVNNVSTPRPTTIASTPRPTTTASTPRPTTTASTPWSTTTASTPWSTTTASTPRHTTTGSTPRPTTTASTPRPTTTASTPRPTTTASSGSTPRPTITASTGSTPRPTATAITPRPTTTGSTPRSTTTATAVITPRPTTTASTGSTHRSTTTASTPRPNAIANTANSSVEHTQKSGQESSRRKIKNHSKRHLAEIAPLQANKKPPAPLMDSTQSSSHPASSTSQLNHSPSDLAKMVPYSSIVKKTSGGPSGSLTSEGTEYTSSGEEEAEANSSGVSVPLPTHAPAVAPPLTSSSLSTTAPPALVPSKLSYDIPHGQQQSYMQQKVSQVSQGKSSTDLKDVEVTTTSVAVENVDACRIDAYVSRKKSSSTVMLKQDNFLPGHSLGASNQESTPIYSSHEVEKNTRNGQESPYLERKVLRDSSLHQEAWPLINHEEHHYSHHSKEKVDSSLFVPPQNTMLFAAAITNTNHHGHAPYIPTHSKSINSLPFSSIPITSSTKGGSGFIDQQHTRPVVNHTAPPSQAPSCSPEGGGGGCPVVSPYLPHSLPQQTSKNFASSSGGDVLDSSIMLLDKNLYYCNPVSTRATLQGPHQYQSGELPPLFSGLSSSSESQQHFSNHFQPGPSTTLCTSPADIYGGVGTGISREAGPDLNGRAGPDMNGGAGPDMNGGVGPDMNGGAGPGIGGGAGPSRHSFSPYSIADPLSCSLGHGSISSASSVTTTNSYHFHMMADNSKTKMVDNSRTKMMQEGISEVQSTNGLAYMNSHGSLYVPPERRKGTPTSSPTIITTTIMATTPSSATAVTSQSLHTRMKVIIPPPSMVDALSQTDLTGVTTVEDMDTQTSETFVPVEALCPPTLSLDSLADRVMFGIKYSLQCLSVYSNNSSTSTIDLESNLEELLLGLDKKLEELQQQAPQLPSISIEQQSPLSFSARPHAENRVGSEGCDQSVSNLIVRKADVMPEQEQFMQSPDLAGMGVPPPLPHPNFPMMMQRPPHLTPFMVPTPSHVPMYYPMMHPHLSMPPVMSFMPFMPPMTSQVAPANHPGVEQQQQQQLDSHPSYQVSTDQPEKNELTQQGNANIMITVNQLEKQSEIVAANAFPIPTLAIVPHGLQQESTESLIVDDLPPVSSSLPLGMNAPENEVIAGIPPPHIDVTASKSKEEKEGKKEAIEETVVQKRSIATPSFVSMERNDVVVYPQEKKPSSDNGTITTSKPNLKSTSHCKPAINDSATIQHFQSSVNPPQHVSTRHAKKSPLYKSTDRNESNHPGLPCRPSNYKSLTETTGEKELHEGGKPRGGQPGENQYKKGNKRHYKYGGKKRNTDPSSSSAEAFVPTEPSDSISKQDPIRQLSISSLVMETERTHRSEIDNIGDAMVFRAILSPTNNPDPDLIVFSTDHGAAEHISSTPVGDREITSELELGETEWPDFYELAAESHKPVSVMVTHSKELEAGDRSRQPRQTNKTKKRDRTRSKQGVCGDH